MAFVVEDGTGLAAANAYVSVAAADSYHSDHDNPSAWSGASESDRENAIRIATEYLDATYKLRWKGARRVRTQALDWPRVGAVDESGYSIDWDELPAKLEDACSVLALKHIQGTALVPDLVNSGDLSAIRVKVGPIEEEKRYTGGKGETDTTTFSLAERLLRDLVWPPGRVVLG